MLLLSAVWRQSSVSRLFPLHTQQKKHFISSRPMLS